MEEAFSCFEDVVWFEPDADLSEPLETWNHCETRPTVGEVRRVRVRHEHQEAVGRRMWLLFQSGLSLVNGFPEPPEELENAAIIEVEVLSQTRAPKKADYWSQTQYDAQVRCLQVIAFTEIVQEFSPCRPPQWPRANREVQIFETPSFLYIWIISQEVLEWFVLTRTEPPRLIVQCEALGDEPFTICNCEWDWAKWPHRRNKTQ